jgi:hypothetical protein
MAEVVWSRGRNKEICSKETSDGIHPVWRIVPSYVAGRQKVEQHLGEGIYQTWVPSVHMIIPSEFWRLTREPGKMQIIREKYVDCYDSGSGSFKDVQSAKKALNIYLSNLNAPYRY